MRHSVSPRSRSTLKSVKRPAWSAVRRLQRATSRSGPTVSSAPFAMGCILGTHAPSVYPSAPVRRSPAARPALPAEVGTLPGGGPPTAAAARAFASEEAVPAVDTNASRVIRRVFFGERAAPTRPREIWEVARALVPKDGKRAWRFNQAVMELGALICRARRPECPACPVRPACRTGSRLVAPDQRGRRQREQSQRAGQ